MSRRPTVAITASVETVTSGQWTYLGAGIPLAYARAVQRAGGRAVLVVPDPADAAEPDGLLERVDALIVSGSAGDVDPAHYGAQAHPETRPVARQQDDFELALVRAAPRGGKPVLGICRGMHVINVAHGGTLHQHLPDVLESDRHRGPPGTYSDHEVRLEAHSAAARAAGAERVAVRSYHHQGVAELGEGLRATAWAHDDDVVEAVEAPGRRFILGVGWHPEEDETSRVVAALVEEARR